MKEGKHEEKPTGIRSGALVAKEDTPLGREQLGSEPFETGTCRVTTESADT